MNTDGIANNKREIDRLKQITDQLDQKSQEDEKRVSDMNVTIENLNMNFAIFKGSTNDGFEDRKCANLYLLHFSVSDAVAIMITLTQLVLLF